MFTLWNAVTGEFDTDWHETYAEAERHMVRCNLQGWRVTYLSPAQVAQVYAV